MQKYNELTFNSVIPDSVSRFASNKALGFAGEESITYAQMGEQISAVMAFIHVMDLKPGDKAIIFSQNMPNWGIVYFALQRMGVVAVPVLPDFNAHELQNVITHSESKSIFISKNLEYKLKDLNLNTINHIVRIDNFELISNNSESLSFDPKASHTPSNKGSEDDLAVLLYTSGTTGDSKGVMLSQKNILFNAIQSGKVQEINENDRFLSILPLSHTYENTIGLVLPMLKGAGVSYLKKPPTANVLLPALKVVKPHLILSVPMIIEKVYKSSILPKINAKATSRFLYKFKPTRKLINRVAGKQLYQTFGGNLKFFGIGGAKLNGKVEEFLRDAKFPYAIGYGLTETAPLLAGSNPTETKLQAIGPMVEDCEVIIHKPDPHTGEGEIWARGKNVMLGYYKNKDKTKEVLTDDGWFKTGDLGVFDKNGYLSHKGRLKNLIVGSNGENIYPEEIESLINNFRHVVESVVLEQKGKLVALVHFNREELEARIKEFSAEISSKVDENIEGISKKVDETINKLSLELKHHINTRVNKSSKLQLVVVHNDPFQKTATKKIKRYLYNQKSVG